MQDKHCCEMHWNRIRLNTCASDVLNALQVMNMAKLQAVETRLKDVSYGSQKADCILSERTARVFVKGPSSAAKGTSDAVRSFVARAARPRTRKRISSERSH